METRAENEAKLNLYNSQAEEQYKNQFAERLAAIGHNYKNDETTYEKQMGWAEELQKEHAQVILERQKAIDAINQKQFEMQNKPGQQALVVPTNRWGITAGPPKAIDAKTADNLRGAGNNISLLNDITNKFRNKYFGYGQSTIGDSIIKGKEISGSDPQQVDFWKGYQSWYLGQLHQMYQSRQTPVEIANFQKSVITPATAAGDARINLDRQMQMTREAAARTAAAASTVGNGNQVYQLLGGKGGESKAFDYTPLVTRPDPDSRVAKRAQGPRAAVAPQVSVSVVPSRTPSAGWGKSS
jgi:hypothetical protein